MGKIECPFCGIFQKEHAISRTWKYGANVVTRFECKCGKSFNFYKNTKSSWTIPKKISKK